MDSRVNLFYTADPSEIEKAEIIIIPGTKNTIEDLISLKRNGTAASIISAFKKGKTVIGICGGYQMMGKKIMDPEMVESKVAEVDGLGILPVNTIMRSAKTTVQRTFRYRNNERICHGYEIHMGETIPADSPSPLNDVGEGVKEGYFLNKTCWGTYLHGILDNEVVIDDLLSDYTDEKYTSFDHKAYKEEQYDKLASWIRTNIDLEKIYESLYL
jgi:adenosylcobyric acid synthase